MEVCILIGGRSRRMGCEKPLIQIGTATLLERALETVSHVADHIYLVANKDNFKLYKKYETSGKVIPANAGIQLMSLDPRFRGCFLTPSPFGERVGVRGRTGDCVLPLILTFSPRGRRDFGNSRFRGDDMLEKALFQRFLSVIHDQLKDVGPIGGIHAGLNAIKGDQAFFLAADLPLLNGEILKGLEKVYLSEQSPDAVVCRCGEQAEPLVAIYSKKILPMVNKQIKGGVYKIRRLLEEIDTRYYDCEFKEGAFHNVNEASDLDKIR